MIPKIRIDDVLQSQLFTPAQGKARVIKPMFEWFKTATENLYSIPLTLTIVAEGIDSQPEWVQYIKDHPLWTPQVHCWEHRNHRAMSYNVIVENLRRAKEKIDTTFGVNTTEFTPPKLLWDKRTQAAAAEVGLTEDRLRWRPVHWLEDNTIPAFYFHYWNLRQIEEVNRIIWQVLVDGS